LVFHARSEYDFKNEEKKLEHGQIAGILESEQGSQKSAPVFLDYSQQKLFLK